MMMNLNMKLLRLKDEKSALLNYLTEIFELDDVEFSKKEFCEQCLNDEYFAVAPVEEGPVEFTYYYDIKSLK